MKAARRQKRQPTTRSKSDDWFTPMSVFAPLHEEFKFDLDAAGHEAAPVSKAIGDWFDAELDGLSRYWDGCRVWVNPPYSDIAPWTAKAARTNGVVVMLLPAWTDRTWWHEHIEPLRVTGEVELRFIRGRVKFGSPDEPDGGRQGGFDPSVIVIFRKVDPVLT